MIRKRLLDDIARIDKGEDPKAIIRDEKLNECIKIPLIGSERMINGYPREMLEDKDNILMRATRSFVFQAGQPDHVRSAYEEALGIKMDDVDIN